MVEAKIQETGCPSSAAQPSVECSPVGSPCDIVITVGKSGKIRFRESP